jgi:hypothetical protein
LEGGPRHNGRNNQEGRDVTVVLCGKDLTVDTETVGQYLMGCSREWKNKHWIVYGLELLWFEYLYHAQAFNSEITREPVIRAISVYSNTG